MDSPKKLDKNVPFQMSMRHHSKASIAETPKQVKVVLKKISPSALNPPESTVKKNTTLSKSMIQTEPLNHIRTSTNTKKTSLPDLLKSENFKQSTNVSSLENNEIGDATNSLPSTDDATPSSHIQPSIAGKKRKIKKNVPPLNTQIKKLKQTVSETANKKTPKVSSRRAVSVQEKVKTKLRPHVAQSSPLKINTASKNCDDCAEKQESISQLQHRIKELEEKEASIQNRLTIYEGLGLSCIQREEENKTLLKKRLTLLQKLSAVEEDLQEYLEKEDAEIKHLLDKKDTLKKSLAEKRKKNTRLDAKEEARLKRLRDETEDFKINEAKFQIEVNSLKDQDDLLKIQIFEEEEKLKLNPKKLPVEEPDEPAQGPCDICKQLTERKIALKKELKELQVEEPALRKEHSGLLEKVHVGYGEVKYMQFETEYLKTRIVSVKKSLSEDEDVKDQARFDDHFHRKEFTEQVCQLMSKFFCGKRYPTEPIFIPALPKSRLELSMIEGCEAEGTNMCCTYLSKVCCRYLCGRNKEGNSAEPMTKEERIKWETTEPGASYCSGCPSIIETEEGKQYYFHNQSYNDLLMHEIDKCFKPGENPLTNIKLKRRI